MLIKLRNYKFPLNRGNRYIRTMTDTLVLLHVIFRHGDRTPELSSIYPTDPHKDNKYAPFGYGQLTNDGKRRAYRFGKSLRKRYGTLFGDSYKPEVLDAWTSDFDRTKMTLQLVLAALFPPKGEQVWNEEIPWQPIPYHCVPKNNDKMFLGFILDRVALEEYYENVNGVCKRDLENFSDLIEYVEKHTGIVIDNPRSMFGLACTLAAQENMGLKLPAWTEKVWPKEIEHYSLQEFNITSATKKLQSITIGKLVQKLIQDSLRKIEGKSTKNVHLYSAHDYTVGMILKTLNVFDWRHPNFCSNVAIELHKIDDVYGFKIKYQITEDEEVKLMEVPNIGTFWPLENFIEDYKGLVDELDE